MLFEECHFFFSADTSCLKLPIVVYDVYSGGMFLYISLVDMMGELTSGLEAAAKISPRAVFKILFLQNLGILVGIISLFLLAKYSENINFENI